jgi:hypothetical protein
MMAERLRGLVSISALVGFTGFPMRRSLGE